MAVPQELIAPTVSREKLTELQSAVTGFDREQLIWTSGYLAGLAGTVLQQPVALSQPSAEAASGVAWNVFYASETGNSRRIAEQLAERSSAAGVTVTVQDLRDVRPRTLTKIDNALFLLATHGLGEAPEGSEAFFEYWFADTAPRLDGLSYSLLALGDSSYADFCEIGRNFDERLRDLGAKAISGRVDCDLDFDVPASRWTADVVEYARKNAGAKPGPNVAILRAVGNPSVVTRDQPFAAQVLSQQIITGRDSSKDVRHIELDLEGSGIEYLPGDSLGVIAENPPQLVDALLSGLGLPGAETVIIDNETRTLHDALLGGREITALSRPVLNVVAAQHAELQSILDDRERFSKYLKSRQFIDLISDFKILWEPQQLVDTLRKLAPRLYSIASGPAANPGEAHLTVGVIDYEQYGRRHWGAASNYLVSDASRVPVFVEPNERFRLPGDSSTPLIMIGAGTGVAPYRSFLEERRELGHSGDNWLVFGDRNFSSDFLYQLEWLRYRKDGLLTRLDVAFSRDSQQKVYVQHRLLQKGAEVFAWLQRGAYVYVCGDAEFMAPDVHAALISIVRKHGGMSEERAVEFIDELKRNRRYQRDVY